MINQELINKFNPPKSDDSYFISFEGIEGSGKTTQIKYIKDYLESLGYEVLTLREPGGTTFGEKLREAILQSEEKVAPMAEACLFASSRAQLLESKVLPFLSSKKKVVIVDRFLDSSLAYQGSARALGFETVLGIHQFAPLNTVPHLSFYLKIDLETSHKRQAERGNVKDYFEKETEKFYNLLIDGYDKASDIFKNRFETIDARESVESVREQIQKAVKKLIGN